MNKDALAAQGVAIADTGPALRRPRSSAWPSPAALILTALVVIGVFAFPWLHPGYRVLSFAVTTAITAIVLYGMAIPFGQAGIMSLGYAGLMGFGGYTAAILFRDFGLNMWEAIPISALIAALAAGLFGLPSLRISGHHFAITTYVMWSSCVLLSSTEASSPEPRRGLTCHRLERCSASSWTSSERRICWSLFSCS